MGVILNNITMRLNDLSQIGSAYDKIMNASHNVPDSKQNTKASEILLTDATQYLPEAKEGAVKPGSPLGGGPGAKDGKTELTKDTGPKGFKGNNFKPVDKEEDPGADKKTMADLEDGDEDADDSNAKKTTAKEKVRESAEQNNKYNYKPKFTMAKPKFDQLFEDALKGVPFNEDDTFGATEDDLGVPGADDGAADAVDEIDPEEEEKLTPAEVIECLEKILASLKGSVDDDLDLELGDDNAAADLDGVADDLEGLGDSVKREAVDAEDEGTPLQSMKKGKPDSPTGSNKVSDLKKSGGTAHKGDLKNEPSPKELKSFDQSLQNPKGSNKVGTLSTGKTLFERK